MTDTQVMAALESCPFCGSDAHWSPTYVDADEPGTVTCAGGCGATVICSGSKAVRIAAWNRRSTPLPPPAVDAEVVLTCLCGAVNKRKLPYDMGKPDSCDHCDCANFGHYSTVSLATPSGRAQGEVKPSAWLYEIPGAGVWRLYRSRYISPQAVAEGWTETPLYAAPPAQDQTKGDEA